MENNTGCIYKLTSPSGKSYIGQTIYGIQNRWRDHLYDAFNPKKNHCKLLNKAIRKYGKDSFEVECLEECNKEDLDKREAHYINNLNTLKPNGYNLKSGGSSSKHTEETKAKIRNSCKKVFEDDTRKKEIIEKRKQTIALGFKDSYEQQDKPKTRYAIDYNPKNPHLPSNIGTIYRRNELVGYIVKSHPNQTSTRNFASKDISLDENLQQAKEFIKYLDTLSEPYKTPEMKPEDYIHKMNHGYRVSIKGKRTQFARNNKTDEELYKQALDYVNNELSARHLVTGEAPKLLVPS
jgi:group I intron endonuclease